MTSNNFTEAVSQKQSNGKMLPKYAIHSQKNTNTDMRIQPKPGGTNIEITRLYRCFPQNSTYIFRATFPHRNISG